jgi:cytochrome b561
MRHRSFLEYRNYRYLKLALMLCVLGIAAYAWHRQTRFSTPGGLGYGGSLMGYGLGTVAALLIVWLMWLGVRKRRFKASMTMTQGWLSAHVYLGLSLVVIATLHTGFELGLNLHTLVYVLMLLVVASGIYGVLVFLREPERMTRNMGEDSIPTLLLQIQEADQQAARLALQLPDEFHNLLQAAASRTRLRGSVFQHAFGGVSRRCPTERAVARMQQLNRTLKAEQAQRGREVHALMLGRRTAVEKIRSEQRSLARLRLWLLVHVPLSFALLIALAGHIVSVFIYW